MGGVWSRGHGLRRSRKVLEVLLWTKSYERSHFKWRKDIVSRSRYFQWELAMPQRDYHPAWNALACRQVLHRHHPFMPYYSPRREVRKITATITTVYECMLVSSTKPRTFHLLSPSILPLPLQGRSDHMSAVWLSNIHSSSHWVLPHLTTFNHETCHLVSGWFTLGTSPWLVKSLLISSCPIQGCGFLLIAISGPNPASGLW